MLTSISYLLFAAAAAGLVILLVEFFALRSHVRTTARTPSLTPPISVLKPLCGIDDDLWGNLESFAQLDYPECEVLLGVRSLHDPAYAVARRAAARWPGRMRVVLQRGEPGLNPKVNQLLTLTAEARHDLLVISDSNIRVPRDYLGEIAAALEDPRVGMVTHPIAGTGARRLGSLLDNLHLGAHVAPGLIAAKRLARKDMVTGKSMALWRDDLAAMGGFESVKDVLAEDYVLGLRVGDVLGKTVFVANQPVDNVSQDRSVRDFVSRCSRWSVLQRKLVGPGVYVAQGLLNPLFLAMTAAAVDPTERAFSILVAVGAIKVGIDAAATTTLRPGRMPRTHFIAVPLKDFVYGLTWLYGLVRNEVNWRGNRLRVLSGSRLAPPRDAAPRELEPAGERAV